MESCEREELAPTNLFGASSRRENGSIRAENAGRTGFQRLRPTCRSVRGKPRTTACSPRRCIFSQSRTHDGAVFAVTGFSSLSKATRQDFCQMKLKRDLVCDCGARVVETSLVVASHFAPRRVLTFGCAIEIPRGHRLADWIELKSHEKSNRPETIWKHKIALNVVQYYSRFNSQLQ
jgi:hypothetical protein